MEGGREGGRRGDEGKRKREGGREGGRRGDEGERERGREGGREGGRDTEIDTTEPGRRNIIMPTSWRRTSLNRPI